MEREGVCKRWFMHDVMHKWEKGCEYENCRYKHERPTKTPESAPAAATAKCNATTIRALPTELTLADLDALRAANQTLRINTTGVYLSRNGFWMQPEIDNKLCTDCGKEHEMMRLCAMHGGYHSLMLNDVRRDIDAIKCRWVPYSVQLAAEDTPALVTATRVCRVQPVALMATRKGCEEGEGGDECQVEPILSLPSKGGYYDRLNAMYAETSDEEDCDD
jgi:hypothetical protein